MHKIFYKKKKKAYHYSSKIYKKGNLSIKIKTKSLSNYKNKIFSEINKLKYQTKQKILKFLAVKDYSK